MSSDLITNPYWWDAVPRAETPDIALPQTSDVVIVGAGFTGVSAAINLARAGRAVTIIEKDRPGEGASSRNGGIASGNLKLGFGGLVKAFGLERAKALMEEAVAARADLARFIADEGIDCDWAPTGRFTGAVHPRHYDMLARETELSNKHLGTEHYMVAKADQHAEIGSDLYHGGQIRPEMAGLHPGKFHQGMLDKAREAGVAVIGRTTYRGHDGPAGDLTVETDKGRVRCRNVIIATNGYTGREVPWLQRRIIPIPSQIIATAPLPTETMDRLMPKRRMLGETKNLYHYFRPSPDGTRIIFGGRAGALTDDPVRKMRRLVANLTQIFPELEGVKITHSWWGYTGFTFDFLPKLVRNDGAHYVAGFCGSGVVWARWLGMKAAQDIIGNAPVETQFSANDFKTRPLYYGKPWFLPFMVNWYALRDRVGA